MENDERKVIKIAKCLESERIIMTVCQHESQSTYSCN